MISARLCRLPLLLLLLAAAAAADAATDVNDESAIAFNGYGQPLSAETFATVRTELHSKINSLWVNHPGNTICGHCLVAGWVLNRGDAYSRRVPRTQLDAALNGQPTDVKNRIKAIAFSNTVNFQLIRLSLSSKVSLGQYQSYMGVARRSGNDVELAILRADVFAALVPKSHCFTRRECRRILFWKKCTNKRYCVRRGLMANELAMVETAMAAEAVRRFREQANRVNM